MSNIMGVSGHSAEEASSRSEAARPLRRQKNSMQEQIERLEKGLRQARALISEELSSTGASLTDDLADAGADLLDRSAFDLERTVSLLLRERGRTKLYAIDDALERIREGSFGVCGDCGEKIPIGRLEVMPFATTCRECKSLQEKRERLFSSDDESDFGYD